VKSRRRMKHANRRKGEGMLVTPLRERLSACLIAPCAAREHKERVKLGGRAGDVPHLKADIQRLFTLHHRTATSDARWRGSLAAE